MAVADVSADTRTLADEEEIIEQGQMSFIEVGAALTRVREGKKYKGAGYDTFEDYCRERWDFTANYARRQIDASKVAAVIQEHVEEAASENDAHGHHFVPDVPRVERTIRPLVKVLNERGPEAVRESWKEIVACKLRQTDLVPEKQRITAKDVSRVVNPPANTGKPGWFELLGLVGEDLLAAQKHLDKVEAELEAATQRKHPKYPNEKFTNKAAEYADRAEGLADRLRNISPMED